ncbi:MAG TPA: hypothetical protein VM900_10175 [Sphingomonas sp.]|jgi:hypothetical protein|nr:hypothetical protein [Sphingomonas sp.]
MKKLSIIGAALALAVPATAYAAADCCKEMACCKDKGDCCKDKQTGKSCCGDGKHNEHDEHAGHDMPAAPAK